MQTEKKEKPVQITKGGAGTLEGLAPVGKRTKKDHEIKWVEWSDAAFERAKKEDRLLLLDITAVWCHWCHVMDETSYSDPEVIRLLNARMIPVRVEADQRPDVQNRYLSGGWPTTAVLVPTGEVLWSGTYVPPQQLRQVLAQVEDYYRKNKAAVQARIDSFKTQVSEAMAKPAPLPDELKLEAIEDAVNSAIENLDTVNGGFGDGQKFPAPGTMALLLLENHFKKNSKIENVLYLTLKNQQQLLDPVWGGFYRYATKPDWSHPHYEKMLSANAELVENYINAYQATGEEGYKKTALEVIRWLENFMQDPKGGFYGSQDADVGSHEPEGEFIAGEEYFNFDDDARHKLGIPHVDKNIYSDWNGQMIRAYLIAYPVLGEKKLLDFALLSLGRIKKTAWHAVFGMAHNPAAKTVVHGLIADQVEVARAAQAAYQVTGKKEYLDFAREIMAWVLKTLQDAKGGGFYSVPLANLSHGNLSIPDKPFDENSTTALALIELYRLTGDTSYKKAAEHTLKLLSKFYTNRGHMAGTFAAALRFFSSYPNQIVIVGNPKDKAAQALYAAALRYYDPNKVVIFLDKGTKPLKVGEIEFPEMDKPALFACRQSFCSSPISDPTTAPDKLKKFFAQTN
ncbi:MAG: DUF255 domain-containing protein [candidate division Zixibacteria bacterium]|nr:DUF255 domain-containing protein [candidate division Zixibacteria bacterium]